MSVNAGCRSNEAIYERASKATTPSECSEVDNEREGECHEPQVASRLLRFAWNEVRRAKRKAWRTDELSAGGRLLMPFSEGGQRCEAEDKRRTCLSFVGATRTSVV